MAEVLETIDNAHYVAKKRSHKDHEDVLDEITANKPWKGYEPRSAKDKFVKGWFECECGKVCQYKHVLARHINQSNLREGVRTHKEVMKEEQKNSKHFQFRCKICGNYYEHQTTLLRHMHN